VYLAFVKLGNYKLAPLLIAAGVIGLVCLIQAVRHDFLERLERMTYDWRVRQAAHFHPTVATNLGFVSITDESITRVGDASLGFDYGLYWPRHIYGRVIRELHAEGARLVAFDILFDGRRTDHAKVWMADGSEMGSDEYFAEQMREAGNVLIASENGVQPDKLFKRNALAMGDISADKDSDGILRRARAFKMYRKWHRVFQQIEDDPEWGVDLDLAQISATQIILPRPGTNAPIIVPLEKDGTFDLTRFVGTNLPPRMQRYSKPFTEERMWHMGILLAAKALDLDLDHANVDLAHGRIGLNGPNGVARVIPVDKDGFFFINWSLPAHSDGRLTQEPFEYLLARDQAQLTGELITSPTNRFYKYVQKPAAWRGKLVIIGSSATGNDLTDRGATSLEKDTLLVSEHWNIANSVLTGKFVRKSSLPMEWLLIILMGVLAAYLTATCRSWIASVWVLAALLAYTLVTVVAYVAFRYWMPLVLPVMGGLLITHFCEVGYLVIFEQAERRRVRNVFSKVVSPDVVTELLKTEKLSLTGARRRVTVFFSDIRGFTEMTDINRDKAAEYIKQNNLTGDAAREIEDAQARDTLNTVNEYLKVIADQVLKHGGTVDKFIGDCVMAFWGAPVENDHHALCCVRAAIDTQRAIHKMNQEREAENRSREGTNLMLAAEGKTLLDLLPVLVVGTGINTGDVTVGLMGSDQQGNYTVFGREVNLASRLETVSGRSRIIISEATLAEIIQDDATLALSCKSLDPVQVKGFRVPVPIFEVPWREGEDAADSPQNTTQIYNTGYFTAADKE
jgi:class 3 adenylate cyclase/CHASE2 domain-containing sensor protein